MNSSKMCVVIPHHRDSLRKTEEASFIKICNKLSLKYDTFLMLPQNVISGFVEKYNYIIQRYNVKIITLYENEFSSYKKYNIYLCSKNFYNYFVSYEYMLLYQLDAWVLEGEIEQFLELNYDYIGAPIFKHNYKKAPEVIVGGGNGGVTLRKISTALDVLNSNVFFSAKKYFSKIGYDYNIYKHPIKYLFKKYFSYFVYFNTKGSLWPFAIQEDVFWSVVVPSIFDSFKVPDLKTSSQFSFDSYPTIVHKYSECLPLFFHAWEKNNDGFFEELYLNQDNDLVIKIKR